MQRIRFSFGEIIQLGFVLFGYCALMAYAEVYFF